MIASRTRARHEYPRSRLNPAAIAQHMTTIRTIDAHTAGEPLRLIVDGFPHHRGRDHAREAGVGAGATAITCDGADARAARPRRHVRRAADRAGARRTRDAGVLFMHNEGYSTMCGHGMIAVVDDGASSAGLIAPAAAATSSCSTRRPGRSTPPPSVGRARGRRAWTRRELPQRAVVRAARRRAGAARDRDVARRRRVRRRVLRDRGQRGGGHPDRAGAARRSAARGHGRSSTRSKRRCTVAHPDEPRLKGIYGTIFTGPRSRPTPICATSRSSPTLRSIDRRAARAPAP